MGKESTKIVLRKEQVRGQKLNNVSVYERKKNRRQTERNS